MWAMTLASSLAAPPVSALAMGPHSRGCCVFPEHPSTCVRVPTTIKIPGQPGMSPRPLSVKSSIGRLGKFPHLVPILSILYLHLSSVVFTELFTDVFTSNYMPSFYISRGSGLLTMDTKYWFLFSFLVPNPALSIRQEHGACGVDG